MKISSTGYYLGLLLIITGITFWIYGNIQPVVNYAEAPLFDGNQYKQIFQFFRGAAQEYRVSFPYHSRVLLPFLASLVPFEDTVSAFVAINFLFSLLSAGTLYLLWQEIGISKLLMGLGFFWLLFHWSGMIRLNQFDPVTVDVPLYFFQTVFIWAIWKQKGWLLIILSPLATLQKESFLALLAILFIYNLYRYLTKKEIDKKYLYSSIVAIFLSFGASYWVNAQFPPLESGRSGLSTMLILLYMMVDDPFRIIRWLAAIFVAFGPPLFLATINRRRFSRLQEQLLLFSLVYVLFGILAGGDMLRIIFLGFPFIMTCTLIRLQDYSLQMLLVVFILSLPLMKMGDTIPPPSPNWEIFAAWYPEYAPPQMVLAWLGYAAVTVVVVLAYRKYGKAV